MRFYIRKRRQPPAVIIVALIDVLIVVLIFLMVTTTFKKPQASLRLALPESSHATKAGASEAPTLIVSIQKDGTLVYGPENLPVTLDRLKAKLLEAVAKNPQSKLAISADKDSPLGQMVRVMDAAAEAKISSKTIDLFTKAASQH